MVPAESSGPMQWSSWTDPPRPPTPPIAPTPRTTPTDPEAATDAPKPRRRWLGRIGIAIAPLPSLAAQEQGGGAAITSVGDKVPASGHLRQGDVVVAIDGKPTNLSQDAVDVIRSHKPGESSQIQVKDAAGNPRTEPIQYGENPETH